MRLARLWWLLLVLLPLHPGCSCNGNGHVEPQPFRAALGANVVNCVCNLSFRHPACHGDCFVHASQKWCVPASLRVVPDAGTIADGGTTDELYAQQLDRYCRETVTNVIYHMIRVWDGEWCTYKEPFAPDGGIGESVDCFAEPFSEGVASGNASSCADDCAPVACDHDTNCHDVTDSTGNIHLDNCACSQVTVHRCDGDPASWLPTPVFCRPTPSDTVTPSTASGGS